MRFTPSTPPNSLARIPSYSRVSKSKPNLEWKRAGGLEVAQDTLPPRASILVLSLPRARVQHQDFQRPPDIARRPSLHSGRLPWLNGVLRLQASATCFFKISSVTASENSTITSFFLFFPIPPGVGSAGRFPFISSRATDPRHADPAALFLWRLQFPECALSQSHPIESIKTKEGGTHSWFTNGNSRYCGHPSGDGSNGARPGWPPPLYFLPPEVLDALPACVHLFLRSPVNGGRRLLSGTQTTASRTGKVSLLPLSVRRQCSPACPWYRPIVRRPAGPGASTSSATSTSSRPSPSPWSAQSTCKCGPAFPRCFHRLTFLVCAAKGSNLLLPARPRLSQAPRLRTAQTPGRVCGPF